MPQKRLLEQEDRAHGHEASDSERAGRSWYPGSEIDIQSHAERVQAEEAREGRWTFADGDFESVPDDVLERTQGAAIRLLYGRPGRYNKKGAYSTVVK
jgi:hypothetical protein